MDSAKYLYPPKIEAAYGLPVFTLERWQSERETKAKVLLSDSGVYPLTISEVLELIGGLEEIKNLELGYGDTLGLQELREGIASLYGVSLENIIITNGSAEAGFITVLALVREGDRVVVDMPCYPQAPGLLRMRKAKIIEVWRSPENRWRLPITSVIYLIRRLKPRIVFVNEPNNPTAAMTPVGELREIIEEAEKVGSIVVVDEVYRGLELENPQPSIASLVPLENIVVISSMSKVYGLPGLRIGWAISSKEIIERLWMVKDYTTISPPVLDSVIAAKILSDKGRVRRLVERARCIVQKNLLTLIKTLNGSNFYRLVKPVWPMAGAFMLLKTWIENSLKLAQQLYDKHKILVVPGECFGLRGYIRIGLGLKPEEYARAIIRLLEALSELAEKTTSS